MESEELERRIESLEAEVTRLRDVEEICIVQRSYGFYYEHWMTQEIVDLFADGDDTTLVWQGQGTFKGKAAIQELYDIHLRIMDPHTLHQLVQTSQVIHVDPSGKEAKGRWYGIGIYSLGGPDSLGTSLYNVDYVKEDGIWKIQMLEHGPVYWSAKLDWFDGVAAPEGIPDPFDSLPFDVRNTRFNPNHPSGYVRPFHYRHPVTGKQTSEAARNESNPMSQFK